MILIWAEIGNVFSSLSPLMSDLGSYLKKNGILVLLTVGSVL